MGYYAMPLLWRDRMIGWVNASTGPAGLVAESGFISGRAPRERSFLRAYEEEVADLGRSLDLTGAI